MDKKKNSVSLNTFISGTAEYNDNSIGKIIGNYKNIPSIMEIYKCMNAYRLLTNEQTLLIPNINNTKSNVQFSFNATQISNVDGFISCIKKHSPSSVITTDEKKKITIKIPINNSRRENRGK